jgi:hypothetical protein
MQDSRVTGEPIEKNPSKHLHPETCGKAFFEIQEWQVE